MTSHKFSDFLTPKMAVLCSPHTLFYKKVTLPLGGLRDCSNRIHFLRIIFPEKIEECSLDRFKMTEIFEHDQKIYTDEH